MLGDAAVVYGSRDIKITPVRTLISFEDYSLNAISISSPPRYPKKVWVVTGVSTGKYIFSIKIEGTNDASLKEYTGRTSD